MCFIFSCFAIFEAFKMKINVLFAVIVLAVIVSSTKSFQLNSSEENINENRIIGGVTAKLGQFTYQISLRRSTVDTTIHRCGGSIISNRWAVTAAQCTQNSFALPLFSFIVVGANHISDDGKRYDLAQIISHPAYSVQRFWLNNISLLQTKLPIQFNDYVKAIPMRRQFVDGGVTSTVVGWGLTRVRMELTTYPLFSM